MIVHFLFKNFIHAVEKRKYATDKTQRLNGYRHILLVFSRNFQEFVYFSNFSL